MVKSVTTVANTELETSLPGGVNARIENQDADAVVYASASSGIVAGANNVLRVEAGCTKVLRGISGKVYLLSAGNVTVEMESADDVNFNKSGKGGGGGISPSEKGTANGVATLDSNGLVPVSQIPPVVMERMITVANDAARFALTTADVQKGDTVKVLSNSVGTDVLYYVVDDAELDNEAGYQVYTAGRAAVAAVAESVDAENATYDNTTSGLESNDVQAAIDELAAEKVNKDGTKQLSDENYTSEEKQKLAGMTPGGSPYTYMTQDEYEALETPDPNALYWVTYDWIGAYIVFKNGAIIDSSYSSTISGGIAVMCSSANVDSQFKRILYYGSPSLQNYNVYATKWQVAGTTQIEKNAFYVKCVQELMIPKTVTSIGTYAFYSCTDLYNFNFQGTMAEWNNVALGGSWNDSAPFTVVHCSDGDSTRLS